MTFVRARVVSVLLVGVLAGVSAACAGDEEVPAATGGGSGDSSGDEIEVGESTALRWGEGDHGVVLAHGAAFDAASWEEQAVAIADAGNSVIAVEDIGTAGIAEAVDQLRSDGVADVALVGGSAGADAILQLASEQPDLPDQLILISPNTTVEGLGEEPKLFIASEDEAVADVSSELAETAPGEDNQVELLPGSAHAQNIFDTDQGEKVLELILARLAR